MARIYRAASYLSRRGASWYFRFRLPTEMPLAADRGELRLGLYTGELAVARIRAGQLLPFVFSLKRLNRHMARLTPDIAKHVSTHPSDPLIVAMKRFRTRDEIVRPPVPHDVDRHGTTARQAARLGNEPRSPATSMSIAIALSTRPMMRTTTFMPETPRPRCRGVATRNAT